MPQYSLIVDGIYTKSISRPEQPGDIPHKLMVWLPHEEEVIDNSTGAQTISSRAEYVIEATRTVTTTTIRDKTTQELSDEKEERQETELLGSERSDSFMTAMRKIKRDHENRLRALEGDIEPQLSPSEWRTYVKARM